MAKSDPTDVLLIHDKWATRNIIEVCAKLTEDQFHQKFEMGVGSLHDSLLHILGAMRGWTDFMNGREVRRRLEEEGPRTPAELGELLDEVAAELEQTIRSAPLETVATGERRGQTYSFTHGSVLCHVSTHGMHHRAQCLNMLRQLGVDHLPPSSVMEWVMMVDTQA